MKDLVRAFKSARNVSTPLIAITTPDPAATIDALLFSYEENPPAMLQWDSARGLLGLNEPGRVAIGNLGMEAIESSQNPVDTLTLAMRLPERAVLFTHNLHRHLEHPVVAQAVWNLRDLFKSSRRTLVLLSPSLWLPTELSQDVWVLHEALPAREKLESILRVQYEAAQAATELPDLTKEIIESVVDATIGLAAGVVRADPNGPRHYNVGMTAP